MANDNGIYGAYIYSNFQLNLLGYSVSFSCGKLVCFLAFHILRTLRDIFSVFESCIIPCLEGTSESIDHLGTSWQIFLLLLPSYQTISQLLSPQVVI